MMVRESSLCLEALGLLEKMDQEDHMQILAKILFVQTIERQFCAASPSLDSLRLKYSNFKTFMLKKDFLILMTITGLQEEPLEITTIMIKKFCKFK